MPTYEGIGLISEKNAIVLDIGTAFTKCGFAGETGPRCIIPSSATRRKTGEIINICSIKDSQELYDVLIDFIHNIYFRQILVNPKDRRVVIVESIMCPTVFKQTLAKVFFKHFEVPAIIFVPSHLMALFTLGISSAVVLDVGYSESLVLPIYEGYPMLNAWQALPLGGEAIHKNLNKLLLESGHIRTNSEKETPLATIMDSLPPSVLENIKIRTCFVTSFERQGKDFEPPPDINYPLSGAMILHIPGKIREIAAEVLFESNIDDVSIATLIFDSLLQCPIDTRKVLAENIIIVGGTAMLPGFKHRLKTTMLDLLQNIPKYKEKLPLQVLKFHNPPAKENYTNWLGASIFSATDVLITRCITREQYLQSDFIPDWSNQLTETTEAENKTIKVN